MALHLTRALLGALPKGPPTPTAPKPKTPILLEVERKFRRLTVPTLSNITTTAAAHTPAFRSVVALPTRQIHDIYYDTAQHALCSTAGAWIRRRNGTWEVKVRRGGDFVNSRFQELRGAHAVGECVASVLGRGGGGGAALGEEESGKNNFGLEVMAEFVTTREAWLVDGEFSVVRDRMDFGHEVGEVELQGELAADRAGMAAAVMEEMDARIEGFMKRYGWAWEEGEAVGKLTAYFDMVKAREGRK